MLGACVRDRDVLSPARSLDVRFDDFMADDMSTARRVFERADQPFTADVEAGMQRYLDTHERGRLGRIDHRAADVGLDVDDLRDRFAPYVERFL
jgi:hypothetical protein